MGCRFIREADKLEAAPALRKLADGIKIRHYVSYHRCRYIVIKEISEKGRSNALESSPREIT